MTTHAPLSDPPSPASEGRPAGARPALFRDRLMLGVAVLFVVDTGWLFFLLPLDEPGWVTVYSRVLVLLAAVSLAFRGRWPVQVGTVVLLLAFVYYPTGEQDGALMMVLYALALYTLASRGHLVAAGVLAAVTVLALAYSESITRARGDGHVDDMALLLIIGWLVGVIAFGHAMRVRQAYLHEAEQRARAAERERDARAQQSATSERLRIARELHDVLGHNISLINVQSSAALHRAVKRPGETAELTSALESVRDTSREALRELRATLGVLRQVDEAAPVAPAAAGLDRLDELAARAGTAGLRVTVRRDGDPVEVPPQISLAAYRIVQESLTNVTRHSSADRAEVVVAYRPDRLLLTIEDNGTGLAVGSDADGSGIQGMAERARALGGHLTARSVRATGAVGGTGATGGAGDAGSGVVEVPSVAGEAAPWLSSGSGAAGGGFRVTAVLPLAGPDRPEAHGETPGGETPGGAPPPE